MEGFRVGFEGVSLARWEFIGEEEGTMERIRGCRVETIQCQDEKDYNEWCKPGVLEEDVPPFSQQRPGFPSL